MTQLPNEQMTVFPLCLLALAYCLLLIRYEP